MELLRLLIEKNPGLFTSLITSLLLPLGILSLTSRSNRKSKEVEKQLEIKFNSKEDIRQQKKTVYSCLSKMLFDVQQLYVSLSGACIEEDCITDAIKKFDPSQAKSHDAISNNILYLSSIVINKVYSFYNEISRLKVELIELNNRKEFDLALVAVQFASQNLAEILMDTQEIFVLQRTDLKIEFERTQQEVMKYCCGEKPPQELIDKYRKLKNTILSNNIPATIVNNINTVELDGVR